MKTEHGTIHGVVVGHGYAEGDFDRKVVLAKIRHMTITMYQTGGTKSRFNLKGLV